MTWTAVSGTVPQYQKSDGTLASAYYLKAYAAGTSTAISIATDTTGGTTFAKVQLDSSGYPVNGSGDPFIPHLGQSYKLVLYKNATDADNNTTANADWVVDNIPQAQQGLTDAWNLFSGTPTRTSDTTFTLTGDQTLSFPAGIRVKFTDSSTLQGIVSASAYTTLTTVTVILDSGALSGSLTEVYTSVLSPTEKSVATQNIMHRSSLASYSTLLSTKLNQIVSITDFGPIGNSSTGDDATFQAAIDALHDITDDTGAQGTLIFNGTIFVTSPKLFGKNITLRGMGRNFRSVISPMASFSGSYLFGIDGTQCIGGFAFRIKHQDFIISNTNIATKAQIPKTYYINSSYDVILDNIWILNARGTGVEVGDSNYVILNDCSFYGINADAAQSEFGVRVVSGSTSGGGGVKIINLDSEVWFNGVIVEADGRAELISPYLERNIVGWKTTTNTSGALLVQGGQVESPGASGTAANISGHNTTVIGGTYKANSGTGLFVDNTVRKQNVHLVGVSGDISDTRNYADKNNTASTNWVETVARNYKIVSDNVATNFFQITVPISGANYGQCIVTVNAKDVSGYSIWTSSYKFVFSNPDGTARLASTIEYEKTNINASANYSLSVTTNTSAAGNVITFSITANSGGALGEGQSPRVSTEARVTHWDSTGGIYLVAV